MCCRSEFNNYVYDVLVDEPSRWALLCVGCFAGFDAKLGKRCGQAYYRSSGSIWRAIPPGKTWLDVDDSKDA